MIYHGQTPAGKKIHLGNWKSPRIGGRTDWVYTFCGCEMRSWEEGERPPASRAADFCKNCFRKWAWNLMMEFLIATENGVAVLAITPELEDVYDQTVAPDEKHPNYNGIPAGVK